MLVVFRNNSLSFEIKNNVDYLINVNDLFISLDDVWSNVFELFLN